MLSVNATIVINQSIQDYEDLTRLAWCKHCSDSRSTNSWLCRLDSLSVSTAMINIIAVHYNIILQEQSQFKTLKPRLAWRKCCNDNRQGNSKIKTQFD